MERGRLQTQKYRSLFEKRSKSSQQKNTAAHRVARLESEYHEAKQSRNTLAHFNVR